MEKYCNSSASTPQRETCRRIFISYSRLFNFQRIMDTSMLSIDTEGYCMWTRGGSLSVVLIGDVVWTLVGIPPVTCVHIYLGADSALGYLCPPVTVSVSFRFHSLCNAHSPLNCLERSIKWSSCMATACTLQSSSRHPRQTSVESESNPRPSSNRIQTKTGQTKTYSKE